MAKYQFALQGALQGKDLPNVSLALQGHGNLDEVALQSLKVDTLGGLVTGNAVANWKNPLNWAARLNLKIFSPVCNGLKQKARSVVSLIPLAL